MTLINPRPRSARLHRPDPDASGINGFLGWLNDVEKPDACECEFRTDRAHLC